METTDTVSIKSSTQDKRDLVSQEIKKYWESKSLTPTDGEGLRPTGRDSFLQQALEEAISKHIPAGVKLLDIGCGDGASTMVWAKKSKSVVAVDYVENYVRQAKERSIESGQKNIECLHGDVLALQSIVKPYIPFDAAISIRCLINLPDEESQFKAVDNIFDCLAPGGLYICSEGWSESWDALDKLREQCGLDKMYLVPHNLLISKERLVEHLSAKAELVAYESLGFYVFLSRVLQPMVTAPEPPRHLHPINGVAAKLFSLGVAPGEFDNIGYPGVCVFRKRG